jgi:ATP/maltotriose-dependent transcriptional regulator MalT
LIHQGWIVFLSGRVNAASVILQEAKQALTAIPAGQERDLWHGRLAAMLATITALTRDLAAAMAEAQDALAYLPAEEYISRARALRALGVCHLFLGEF